MCKAERQNPVVGGKVFDSDGLLAEPTKDDDSAGDKAEEQVEPVLLNVTANHDGRHDDSDAKEERRSPTQFVVDGTTWCREENFNLITQSSLCPNKCV